MNVHRHWKTDFLTLYETNDCLSEKQIRFELIQIKQKYFGNFSILIVLNILHKLLSIFQWRV